MSKDKNKKSELNIDEELMIPMEIKKEVILENDAVLYRLIDLHDHAIRLRDKYKDADRREVAYGIELVRNELNAMIKKIEK